MDKQVSLSIAGDKSLVAKGRRDSGDSSRVGIEVMNGVKPGAGPLLILTHRYPDGDCAGAVSDDQGTISEQVG